MSTSDVSPSTFPLTYTTPPTIPQHERFESTDFKFSHSYPQTTALPPPINSKENEPVFFNTQNSGSSNFGSCFIKAPERVPTRPPI